MIESVRYEVILVPSDGAPTRSEWTWRRLEQDGSVSAQGLRHDTMNACFAEVRNHRSAFGEATITVNLRGDDAAAATPSAPDRVAPVLGTSLKRRFNRQVALGR